MYSYNGAYTARLFRLLKLSGINFVTNPLVNIHLQGRFDDYPKRCGVTRVKEMLVQGINVCFGHDDVFDPWHPLGTGNMLPLLHMGLHVCQLMGYEQINNGLNLITGNGARTLNLSEYGIKCGYQANLSMSYGARCRGAMLSAAGGWIAHTPPSQSMLCLQEPESVNFR